MKVSVVVPTFKRPFLLSRLLNTLVQQTYHQFEVIVVDDNSPQIDDYQTVIKQYQSIFPLTYLRNDKNFGSSFTRNRGILETSSEHIALVDDDDEWLPEKLEKQVEAFQNGDTKLGLVYTWTKAIQNSDVVYEYTSTYSGNPLGVLLLENFIPSSSVMVSKKAIIDAGLFDVKMPSCEDWDLWTRLLHKGYSIDVIKSYLTLYHKHQEESIGLSPNVKKGYEIYYRKHLPLFWQYHKKMYLKMKVKSLLKPIYKGLKRVMESQVDAKSK